MKKCFIAYFDILGFKEFILNNDNDTLMVRMGHVFRDIESALGLGKLQEPRGGLVLADISNSKLNCLNVSDTVVFWTNDCTKESFEEIVKIAHHFNERINTINMPVRGALICDELRLVDNTLNTEAGGKYGVSCLYGKGIVKAHVKAENQNWAGSVIDQSIIDEANQFIDVEEFLSEYTISYLVPYKKPPKDQQAEFVFRIAKGEITQKAFDNFTDRIIKLFSDDGKDFHGEGVQEKYKNTMDFVKINFNWKE